MAARRFSEVEDHAVLLVQGAHEITHLRAEDALHGSFSGATTWTSISRARSAAATSSPMKLAPSTTARRAVLGPLDDRAAVGERTQHAHMRQVRAGDRQADRLGAGREQQPVVSDPRAIAKHDLARTRVDASDVRLEPKLDAVLGIEAVRPQRHPFLRRIAGKIVLGQIRSIDGRRIVVAQHDDASLILFATQFLGRGEAGRSSADDDNCGRGSGRRQGAVLPFWLRQLLLVLHEDLAVAAARHSSTRQGSMPERAKLLRSAG